MVKDMAFSLQSEINRVGALNDGYRRSFLLDTTLDGIPYNTTISGTTLIVTTRNYEYDLSVLPIAGNFTLGGNYIRKTNGQLFLNK